jgi:hypothetical protein
LYTTDITPDFIKQLKHNMHDTRQYVNGNADRNGNGKQTKFGSIIVNLGAGLTAKEAILKPAPIYQDKINT